MFVVSKSVIVYYLPLFNVLSIAFEVGSAKKMNLDLVNAYNNLVFRKVLLGNIFN